MTVKEFFEAFAPIITLHEFNQTGKYHTLQIELSDGCAMGCGYFTANGKVTISGGGVSVYDMMKPFENVFFGKEDKKEKKVISALALMVKEWKMEKKVELTKNEIPEDYLLLKIEIDNNINMYL